MTRSRQTADWGSRAGLAKIVPSSVAVGSGTGSADSLGNVTFSGASSVSLNGCFSSAYTNYKIIIQASLSSTSEIGFRLRASGTDLSSSVYIAGHLYIGVAQSVAFTSINNTAYSNQQISSCVAGGECGAVIDIFEPFTTKQKTSIANGTGRIAWWSNTQIQSAVSYDGFSLIPNAGGTMTGTVRVYGYTQ